MVLFGRLEDICRDLVEEQGWDAMTAITERLSKEPDFLEAYFSPDTEGAEAGKSSFSLDKEACALDFRIPVCDGEAVKAVFVGKLSLSAKYDLERQAESAKSCLERICSAFNQKTPKGVVLENTRWGRVEIRRSDEWRSVYRLDGAVLYTKRFVIEYLSREEAERWAEKVLTGIPDKVKEIDENYTLDYPLFKMKIRRYDGGSLSHEQDEDGVWWVNVPRNCDFSLENVKMCLCRYFDKVLLSAGQQYFTQRVEYLQSLMKTPKIIRSVAVVPKLDNAWGLNTMHKDDWEHVELTFDASLMRYPANLADYVIIHELCHNWVRAHNKKFHELEANWCLLLLQKHPDHFSEFLKSHNR